MRLSYLLIIRGLQGHQTEYKCCTRVRSLIIPNFWNTMEAVSVASPSESSTEIVAVQAPRNLTPRLPVPGEHDQMDDAYYAKLKDFYSEWSTFQLEVDKLKQEESSSSAFG